MKTRQELDAIEDAFGAERPAREAVETALRSAQVGGEPWDVVDKLDVSDRFGALTRLFMRARSIATTYAKSRVTVEEIAKDDRRGLACRSISGYSSRCSRTPSKRASFGDRIAFGCFQHIDDRVAAFVREQVEPVAGAYAQDRIVSYHETHEPGRRPDIEYLDTATVRARVAERVAAVKGFVQGESADALDVVVDEYADKWGPLA